jgi:hypothetical protein
LKDPLPEFYGLGTGFLFEEFVNWPDRPQDILKFTKLYGPLETRPSSGADYKFSLNSWRAAQQSMRETWELFARIKPRELSQTIIEVAPREQLIRRNGRLEYRASSLLRLIQLELTSIPTERLRQCKCERSDCPQRYFVAHHLGQLYATEPCARAAQREWKKQWWKDNGEKWRRAKTRNDKKLTKREKR